MGAHLDLGRVVHPKTASRGLRGDGFLLTAHAWGRDTAWHKPCVATAHFCPTEQSTAAPLLLYRGFSLL